MIEDIEFLDDATRPRAPKLDGLTPEQRAPGEHLREIHDHLRHNMRSLRVLIERASVGDVTPGEVSDQTAAMTMIANFRRFGTLCGQHCQFVNGHHSIEDAVVFPRLAATSEAFRRVAERLKAEHVVVHELLVRLVGALQELARTPTRGSFDAAVELYDALEGVLLSHLGYEEDEIGDAIGYFGIV